MSDINFKPFKPINILYCTEHKVSKGMLEATLKASGERSKEINLNIRLYTGPPATGLPLKNNLVLDAHLGDDIEAAKPLAEAILKEIIEWMNR